MSLPVSHLAPFVAYATAMSITPGPNNAMLAMLGARHGWRGALPAAAGVMTGLFTLLVLAGSGLAAAMAALPGLSRALLVGGIAYMAYLALALWRATPGPAGEGPTVGFWGAVSLQAVNPKALLMAISAAGTFLLPGAGTVGAAVMAALFVAVATPCVTAWAVLGDRLASLLRTPARARWFTRGMAVVVAATALAMAAEG